MHFLQRKASEATFYLLHHVFLPPRTPQTEDYDFEHEIFLLDEVIEALRRFRDLFTNSNFEILNTTITMIVRLKCICTSGGDVNEIELARILENLKDEGGFLPIYVREQNSGVLFSQWKNMIHVESFELSPRNKSVTMTVGRLVRDFPGPGIALNLAAFDELGLRGAVAQTIARMSYQPAADTKPKVKKARQEHDEDRDTTHPKMVTELLMATLRPLSTDISAIQIRKNTREQVMWRDSRSPWRRSALWLLIRVTLQLVFCRLSDEAIVDDLYKHFMVFFMSYVVDKASVTLPSEALFCMNAKIVRRMLKLELSNVPVWFTSVQNVLKRSSGRIQGEWEQVMRKNSRVIDTASLSALNFSHDTYSALPGLDRYLQGIERRGQGHPLEKDFQPLPKLYSYRRQQLPDCLEFQNSDYQWYNLAALEDWVALHLNAWLENHRNEETVCSQLGHLMIQYHQVASSSYRSNPEAVSVMLLTLLELWVACDKSGTQLYGDLVKYDACIPIDCFQSLLLPLKSQMARLACAEKYLSERQRKLKYHGSGIFHDYGTPSCFSVRYFNQSNEHQRLLEAIEDHAKNERSQKQAELREKHRKYRHMMDLISGTTCRYEEVILDARSGFRESHHSNSCPCHEYKRTAKSIDINIHEWPLPTDPLQAKSTVFELKVPTSFASWRDTTLFFLYDCLGIEYTVSRRPRAEYQLEKYPGLSSFFTSTGGKSRIGLLSQNKPHQRTHRRNRLIINVTEKDVCLNNGLNFQYFDNTVQCYVEVFEKTLRMENSCVYTLPQQCSVLQQFIFRPAQEPHGPAPNLVIATQSAAPANMLMEEYKALAALPLGLEIQWQNILVELAAPSVDMKKVETAIFILQIMTQAGPPKLGTSLRQGHVILEDEIFVIAILTRVKEVAERIKENWEMVHGLNNLIRILLRILNLSASRQIHELCLDYLAMVRQTAFHWVNLVRRKASETVDDTHKTSLIARSVHIALICVDTFNVENLTWVFAASSDISIFLQCCMIIWNGRHTISKESGSLVPILFHRWQVLSYRSHSVLAAYIVQNKNPGMDSAVHQAWAAYSGESTWSKVSNVAYWVVTQFMPHSMAGAHMLVHYNLLTGELLVDGLPLARLPSDYESHRAYRSLFGKSQLDVMPSSSPGMQFSCQTKYLGHTVHLGKEIVPESTEFDLTVRAVRDGRVWEFVPSRLLAGLLPDAFVTSYAHWYAVEDDYVEFRPAERPWASDDDTWRLQRSASNTAWRLEKHGSFLVSTTSQTANMIVDIFQPVEKALKIHCILHAASSTLWVELPRLRLEFTLQPQSSSLQSRQYPGMSIENNQAFESLIGQHSKIVLVNSRSHDRLVLIPEGRVSYAKNKDHVRVEIGWQCETALHAYSIDDQLGRLVDNGSLQSKLYLAYLHALTSFCLPDPLTKKTGTEQALSILRSASVRSFERLEPEHIALLSHIASLSPGRSYYPANERVMENVCWQGELGSLSQHHSFREEVDAILDQNRRMGFFFPDVKLDHPSLPHVEPDLLLRDRIRTSSFRVSGFGAEDHTEEHDQFYKGLDTDRISPAGTRSFAICKMLYDEIPRVRTLGSEELTSQLWKFLSLHGTVHGPSFHIDSTRLRYDSEWILGSNGFIASHWCCIHQLVCSRSHHLNKFQLMAWLSTIAFSGKTEMMALEIIASLFVVPEFASIPPPARGHFLPSQGYNMDRQVALSRIKGAQLEHTPESNLVSETNETYAQFTSRRKKLLKQNRTLVFEQMLLHFASEWPTRSPSYPTSQGFPRFEDYLNVHQAWSQITEAYNLWRDNEELRQWVTDISTLLSNQQVQIVKFPAYTCPSNVRLVNSKRRFMSLDSCLQSSPDLDIEEPQLTGISITSWGITERPPELLNLVDALDTQAKSKYEKWYVTQLRSSITSLKNAKKGSYVELGLGEYKKAIFDYLVSFQDYAQRIHSSLMSQITPFVRQDDSTESVDPISAQVIALVFEVQQGPRLSPVILLEQLSRHRWYGLDSDWKRSFVHYGCSIASLQRAKRLANAVNTQEDLLKELQNSGHTNWDPSEFPETLLLEIENGILIRDVQENIARKMRNFPSGENAVMQLNMGEGKSSVIVPIVVTAHANGSSLARVLVAKPQSRQMFQMLVSKLGGILGRRVYHMPISRSLKLGEAEADEIEQMCFECMSLGGVLLVQPEHILSMKLMCLECFIVGNPAVGRSLLRILQFFQNSSRDIVDESDENFNVKFELIYTMGTQRSVELSPQRWTVIQEVLRLIREYADRVKDQLPHSIQISEHQPGRFPRIRLLDRDAEQALLSYIGTHICESGIGSLPISRQAKPIRDAVSVYIMKSDPTPQEIAAVECDDATGFWGESTRSSLLLVRGLLAGGVSSFCLGQKRWRVNYGSDPTRDPPTRLCVPYRAKDSPSLRSEFSHPDVVIFLTCLNYYYSGLQDDDIFLAFNHLVKSDQADAEYQVWVDDAPTLSPAYHQLVGVNLDDRNHCTDQIFPSLRFSKATVDYFLSHIVFPKEMKEFPNKLSASGWDIGEIKSNPTVGFSGTNDSRKTLPLSVSQLDLPEQNHTNALVLEYLLQQENSVACIPHSGDSYKSDAQILLDLALVLDPPAQVILDVGAQILELSNQDMAKAWLRRIPTGGTTQAIVFVNDQDDICVLDRNGRVESLQTSPFAQQMGACLVFLDEAHTRGIDLKLPVNYRAAVTLGPGITKDKLVQGTNMDIRYKTKSRSDSIIACMRMRKLGNGQSVVFCIPNEVRFNILALRRKDESSPIDVSDVLHWAVSETWSEIRRSVPLWAVQGTRFERQQEVWQDSRQSERGEITSIQAQRFLEPECQTLEQRYRPGHQERPLFYSSSDTNQNLNLIGELCREFEVLDVLSSALQEEQERELAPEIEIERQVQRPQPATPASHHMHPHITSFVATGVLTSPSEAYKPAFCTLQNTSAASLLDITQFPSSLLATKDFSTTINFPPGSALISDAFQRPVRWIMTSNHREARDARAVMQMMIISPYEANCLMPEIQKSNFVSLRLYAPRQNRGCHPLDRFTLYNVPENVDRIEAPDKLRIELNLFSGQLYLDSYSDYKALCEFLGVASFKTPPGLVVAADGFIQGGSQGLRGYFSQSPLKFLKFLMSQIRKDCQDIGRTHVGYILDGRLLFPSDFVESAPTSAEASL